MTRRSRSLLGEPLGNDLTQHLRSLRGKSWRSDLRRRLGSEKSRVPNVNGIRKELVEEIAEDQGPVVRYPGGCFADSYDWRDGVGPADKRPRRTNFWQQGRAQLDPPAISTIPTSSGDQRVHAVLQTDWKSSFISQPSCAAFRPLEFYRWVEYCNSPAGEHHTSPTCAPAAGYAEPFRVRYWGVGNESWGCGGNFTAQEYAVDFAAITAWVPEYGQKLSFVASGPSDDKWDWTLRVSGRDCAPFSGGHPFHLWSGASLLCLEPEPGPHQQLGGGQRRRPSNSM
jgi:hypothetical protein